MQIRNNAFQPSIKPHLNTKFQSSCLASAHFFTESCWDKCGGFTEWICHLLPNQ